MVGPTSRRPRLGIGVPRRRSPRTRVPWLRVDPAEPGYPWEAAALHPANFPTPSLFWDGDEDTQWLENPHFDEVVRAALGSALLMAGVDPGLATSRTSHSRRLRQQMRGLMITAPLNDQVYGCTNANYCGGTDPSKPGSEDRTHEDLHVMGPDGRGLNFLPRHAPNRDRIARGLSVARAINEDGESLLSNAKGRRPLLWVPAINIEALRGTRPVATVEGMKWSDGTSTLEVPPRVRALGILEDVRKGEP